jgi:hypothetical protein
MVAALAKRMGLLRGLLLASLIVSTGSNAHAQGKGVSGRQIDKVLRNAVEEKGLPGVVAMVAQGDAVVYQGAFGKQYAVTWRAKLAATAPNCTSTTSPNDLTVVPLSC